MFFYFYFVVAFFCEKGTTANRYSSVSSSCVRGYLLLPVRRLHADCTVSKCVSATCHNILLSSGDGAGRGGRGGGAVSSGQNKKRVV